MDAAERLLQFIDFKGFGDKKKGKSLRQFYALVELSMGTFKPGRIVGSDALKKVSDKFPDLNTDWIITERGEMIYREPAKQYAQLEGDKQLNEPSEGYSIAMDAMKDRYSTLQEKLIACMEERDELRKNSFQLPGAS